MKKCIVWIKVLELVDIFRVVVFNLKITGIVYWVVIGFVRSLLV